MKEEIKCAICESSEEINYNKNLHSWLCKICSQPKKTLRDEFAMAALPLFFNSDLAGELYWREAIADLVYKMADAMLEARKAKG